MGRRFRAACEFDLKAKAKTVEEKKNRIVVADENGAICGIISIADLAKREARSKVGTMTEKIAEGEIGSGPN